MGYIKWRESLTKKSKMLCRFNDRLYRIEGTRNVLAFLDGSEEKEWVRGVLDLYTSNNYTIIGILYTSSCRGNTLKGAVLDCLGSYTSCLDSMTLDEYIVSKWYNISDIICKYKG